MTMLGVILPLCRVAGLVFRSPGGVLLVQSKQGESD
jgi:hypothetical protein